MRKLAILFLVALLSVQIASAKVFYYADETDYRNNMDYALSRPFDGVNADDLANLDHYSCITLNDYNAVADENAYDSVKPITAATVRQEDLDRLRRADQLKLADENPYDGITRDSFKNPDSWNCYALRDYNALAAENHYDDIKPVDFTHMQDLQRVQEIGKYRYNDFYQIPDDFAKFNLQFTVVRPPYYEPYDVRYSPYPLYGYGVRRVEDY